jgi:hypothetical protein
MPSRQQVPSPPSGVPAPGGNAAGRGVMDNYRQSNARVRSSSQHSGGSNPGGRVSFPVDKQQQNNHNYAHQSSPSMMPKTNPITNTKNQRSITGPAPLQEMSNGWSNSPKARAGDGGRPPLPNQQRSPKDQIPPHHSFPFDVCERDSSPTSPNRPHKRTGGVGREREQLVRKSTNDGYASTGNLIGKVNTGHNSGHSVQQINRSGYDSPKDQARQRELTDLKKQISDSKAAIYKHSITVEAARAPLHDVEQALTAENAEQQAAERRRQRAVRKERERQQQHGEQSASPKSPQRDDMFYVPARQRRTRGDEDQYAQPYSSVSYGERQPRASRHARPPPVATVPSAS